MALKRQAIGIDLGTSYSCAGVFHDGRFEMIPNEQGHRTTPSYIAFADSELLVGEAAKDQAAHNPENTVFGTKRLLGWKLDDLAVHTLPFKVTRSGEQPAIRVDIKGTQKTFSPEEITSMVFAKMKDAAEAYLGCQVEDAVIAVPAYFNDLQRSATKQAATIAGLNVLRIISEPTAAALAYGLDKKYPDEEKNVLTLDLGGGSFDITVSGIEEGIFEVKSTVGHSNLGGEAFDQRLVDHLIEEFKRRHDRDIIDSPRALWLLRNAAERAKMTLSSNNEAIIQVDSLYRGIDFHTKITRSCFEDLCSDLFRGIPDMVEKTLRDAQLDKDSIQEVGLVGGCSRIPRIRGIIEDFFNGKQINHSISPEEAVAHGAAMQAAILSAPQQDTGELIICFDTVPLSLGVETAGGLTTRLIERNARVPTKADKIFSTFTDNQSAVTIRVYQGERAMTKDNLYLGQFDLTGIPSAPKGVPQIQVTFFIDANSILTVSAKELSSGRENSIVITNYDRLTHEDIERMLLDAETYKEEDDACRARAAAVNHSEEVNHPMTTVVNKLVVHESQPSTDWQPGPTIDEID